ncbi:Zinc finger protein MAGPIE [Dichanthelium oligosanthes]|uniref:Protein EARLY HEADING DATE 2 n=1 Tax=Dichanthelium oligosanthes TaxID=888268 RepID=A0A1E5VQB0_9POAL|nr:Zinc finger protein MAGPIE [Dichanthelium oligosanthes]
MTPHPTEPETGPPEQTAPGQPEAALPLAAAAPATVKKKRNLPGTPDPDAEVIALSPGTLLATNRFVCEVCGKGFQRDQNLQLHRRGHNLPWRLRQRGPGAAPPRRRVYVCPESGCVHHSPARALGDLTGIKKHFCRKHGEKRWACPRCGKRYAVQADLKAHAKTCGTREYRCDCGTLFTRRDSFVTHRAFCGALVEETGRVVAPPAPPSPRPPDLEAPEENVDKDKEKGQEEEENEDSAVAEVEQPQRVEAPAPEVQQRIPSPPPLPQRIPSPPPLPQQPPRRPSPPPLPKEPPRRPSPPPLPKEPQLFPSPLPFPLEQRPVVAVVPNVDEPEVVAETTVTTMTAKLEDEADQDEDTCFQEADQYKEAELEVSNLLDKDTPMLPCFLPSPSEAIGTDGSSTTCGAGGSVSNSIAPSTTANTFAGLFASATTSTTSQSRSLRDLIGVDPTFLCLAIGAPSSLFPQTSASNPGSFAPPPAPHMSATALLQKAAEVGASQSSSSFLKEFGLASSSSSSPPSKQLPQGRITDNSAQPWHHRSNQQMGMERHRNHQQREMESSSQPWHHQSNQQMEMDRHRNHQQREMESSSQPWHHRSTQQMEMERLRNNQQREMESSSQRWHHHRNDQQMDIERYRGNQQMEMESSTQRWPHHRSSQQIEMMGLHRSSQQMERESRAMLSGGLGLGLAYESGNSGLPDLMMGPSPPLFGPKPATLDFLGLGIGGTMGGSTANGGLPALMVGGELDMGSSAQVPASWEDANRKTNGRTIL